MDDAPLMRGIHAVGDLARDLEGFWHRHAVPDAAFAGDSLGQRVALEQLQDEPAEAVAFGHTIDCADVPDG